MMRALHEVLNAWLGEPRTKQTEGRVTFLYRFESEDSPPIPLRLKVEINSREHFSVHGFTPLSFAVSSRWFEGACKVTTYRLEELLGTKLRALYQRRQGRDTARLFGNGHFDQALVHGRAEVFGTEVPPITEPRPRL